jgi:hypothetical protein
MSKQISTFFYGSFMRSEVMQQAGFAPDNIEVAQLHGHDICLDPHANVFKSPMHSVFGILVKISHAELDRMYGANGVGIFLPEAVLVSTLEGRWEPAMCYMPPHRTDTLPDQSYLARLIEAAQARNLPSTYIARLQAYAH